MQEIQLYSDATFFEKSSFSKKLACGASILRYKDASNTTFTQKKYIYIFNADHSSHAELITGITILRHLFKSNNTTLVQWRCDLPYLKDLLVKDLNLDSNESKDSPNLILLEIQKIYKSSLLSVDTPNSSQEIHYHTLCHRVCRMIRPIIKEIQTMSNELPMIRKEIEHYLQNRNSPWNLLLPEEMENKEFCFLQKN